MYNRDFGGIKSEGTLYNLEREYNSSGGFDSRFDNLPRDECPAKEEKKGTKLDFLRNLKLDDLILIAIGILLLLDSEEDNDVFLILIAFLLFF